MRRITPVYIYIIGQIKGLPIDEAKANFERIENKLRELGYSPINPLKLGIPEHWDYEQSRPHNMKALAPCEAVYIQSNWRKSDGSKDEIYHSMQMGKEIYYAEAKGLETLEEQARFLFERELS